MSAFRFPDWSDRAQLAAAQANPDTGYIVDAPHEDAPLVIAFGFVDWTAPPVFDFAGRLCKLATTTGQPLNRILIRDTANFWYQHGVTGLGEDPDEVAASLRGIIAQIRPRSVNMIGQSMGGYAAILFGILLGADRVLAFGPLSYLRSDWARRDGDIRWLQMMEMLDRHPPPRCYDDLPSLMAAAEKPPQVRILFGIGPEDNGWPNSDAIHASRFATVRDVMIARFTQAPHAVVKWLIDTGQIDRILEQWLSDAMRIQKKSGWRTAMGTRHAPTAKAIAYHCIDDNWRRWIAENLVRGVVPEAMMSVLTSHNFHPGEAQREIYKASRSPYLLAVIDCLT